MANRLGASILQLVRRGGRRCTHPYQKLPKSGLSADYVARETKRAIAGYEIKIYSGIDIDVPGKRTGPDDVKQAIHAAFGAGADGVVLLREYV
jgi:hypothetical protein